MVKHLLRAVIGVCLFASSCLFAQPRQADADKKIREIFVPFEELSVLLEKADERVFLTREEYEELIEKAKVIPDEEKSPRDRVLLSADYDIAIRDGRATVNATIPIEVMTDSLLGVQLGISGMNLRSATLDGEPAALGRSNDGSPILFVKGKGKHELKMTMFARLATTAAQQSLQLQLVTPTATRWRLTVPGNVELKSGTSVISRSVDAQANETRFELLPQREPTTLVLSLNNRLLMQERVVLARSVLLDEITQSYERLHATVSLGIPHGAVETFRFELPEGFEVTDVSTPLLARWAVEKEENNARVLDVALREPTTETVVISIVAANNSPNLAEWKMPQLKPLDTVSHVAVVGVLAEDRLAVEALQPMDLLPIDVAVLTAALPPSVLQAEPGAPKIRPLAAYYAPQPAFDLTGVFRKTPARFEVTSNLLLTVSDEQLQLRAGFAILPKAEKLFTVEVVVPAGWQVVQVTQNDGSPLPYETFPNEMGASRLQIRLPQGAVPEQFFNVFIDARSTPAGWLSEWSQSSTPFPAVSVSGADRDVGAIAVRAEDDLTVRPDQLAGLTPLDDKEKAEFGLAGTVTSLAYRYESQPYSASLAIEREVPRLTARTFSFLRIEPEGVFAHYELLYQIDHARARRLSFRLPANTPEAISIRGIDVPVKEFRSEIADGERLWTAELSERRSGLVRLAIDFQQSLPGEQPKDYALPIIRAEGVAFQSGTVAVEGSTEFDLQLKTAARPVDVGELVDAEYQIGKRLLGAYGFIGDPGTVAIDVFRRPEYGLPAAIVQRAELVTLVSAHGLSQTAARYHLRTKAAFLEVVLPAGAELWSATIGGRPSAPQREGDRLLISLPALSADEIRDLQLVFELPTSRLGLIGTIQSGAPRLRLRELANSDGTDVPMADLEWHLVLPNGHRLVRAGGTVFTSEEAVSPVNALAEVSGYASNMMLWDRMMAKSGAAATEGVADREVSEATSSRRFAIDDDLTAAPAAAEPATAPSMVLPQSETQEPRTPAIRYRADAERVMDQKSVKEPVADSTRDRAEPDTDGRLGGFGYRSPDQSVKDLSKKYWALQGVRSLPIALERTGEQVTFRSMGVEPRLHATLANVHSFHFLATFLAIVVGIAGLCLTFRSASTKTKFIITVVFIALAAPSIIGLVIDLEVGSLFVPALLVACLLVPWYILVGIVHYVVLKIRGRRVRVPATPVTPASLLLALALMASSASAQQPATASPTSKPTPALDRSLLELLVPSTPIKLPDDAIIVPYNADDPAGIQNAKKVIVPYEKYVQLWNQAFPDKPLTVEKLPTTYAIAGASYTTTLASNATGGDESLVMNGRMLIDVFSDDPISIPLKVGGGVITQVTLDGQPARIQIVQPQPQTANQAPQQAKPASRASGGQMLLLQVAGKGRKDFRLSVRFKLARTGGWRIASGQVPAAPATSWDITVPTAKTEVRTGSGELAGQAVPRATVSLEPTASAATTTTTNDNETIQTAIDSSGTFRLQWRAKLDETQVDHSLTARSVAVLDIQEDGARLAWKVSLEFGRGLRDSFAFTAPPDFLVERVTGTNVRGWKSTPGQNEQTIEITLLKPAATQEAFTFLLTRRSAVGQGEMKTFAAPALTVRDAALHQGVYVLRRSPLLDVRVAEVNGLSRADVAEDQIAAVLANASEESPLGIRPFQSYRFATTPFLLRLAAFPYDAKTTAEVQALLKVADRESRYEANVVFNVENRPRYSAEILLPNGLTVDSVVGPSGFEWNVVSDEDRNRLVVLLPSGARQFSIVIRGRFGARSGETLEAPRLEVQNVDQQRGYVVVQADPAYDVRAEELRNIESVLMERVFPWLQPEQRPLARVALYYSNADYSAMLRVVPRTPRVNVFTISNVRITPFAIEDTVYLKFTIQDAGIRQVVFQLPATMRDARITVPLLRQKTIEPIANDPEHIRVTLDLQDEVMQQLIVLVQNDRSLTGGTFEAPIPVVETGETDQRYVVLESAGRDEVVVAATRELTELNRQQSQWAKLVATLGDKITQAYVVRDDAVLPRLTIQTQQRAAVETARARIGLAKTTLIVDGNGAYRGEQLFQVDNKTEQYLEIELPASAELWTVQVAGEPVKPTIVSGQGTAGRIRIPLIKTAPGDLDYAVVMKYGGDLGRPKFWRKTKFPLIHTVNVHVEQSQVKLLLPETHRWFDFGGTMRRVTDEGDLAAGYFSYKSKQIEQLLGVVQSSGDDFSKVRASNNLKQLGLSLNNFRDGSVTYGDNAYFQRELTNNSALLQRAEQVLSEGAQVEAQVVTDNRSALNYLSDSQEISRSKNVVTQLRGNFDVSPSVPQPMGAGSGEATHFNLEWLKGNKLKQEVDTKESDVARKSRVELEEARAGRQAGGKASVEDERGRAAANELGKQVLNSVESTTAAARSEVTESREIQARTSGERRGQVERYQQRLEQQQAGMSGAPANQPADPLFGSQPATPAKPAENALPIDALNAPFGEDLYRQSTSGAIPARAPTGLKSLDVELPHRGVEYSFVTPRGEIEIEARSMMSRQCERLLQLVALVLIFAVILLVYRLLSRYFSPVRHTIAGN